MDQVTEKGFTANGDPSPLSFLDRAFRFGSLLLELVLIAVIVYSFHIESTRHFFPVLCFTIVGFAIHVWLPKSQRIGFFAFLSASSVLFLLGFVNGMSVLGIGSVLMSICVLPIASTLRWGLLITAGAILIVLRLKYPAPFWPVAGSMFMFRLICFFYECRREKTKPSLASSVSYFFLLPNACFPFFPVIDFRTFRDSYDQNEEWETYQEGITWIVRGLIHLLLYRYIRSYLVPKPYELHNISRLAFFMMTNYSLYLQVSGQFHIIKGMLHLFGFRLPRTHHNYFLASSFTDIWRRINIYWKDFLSKYVFFPTFYLLRYRGASAHIAMIVSVLIVFVSTWLLHSWQTFWILGRFPLTIHDAALWLSAGIVVAANVVLDSRRAQRRETSLIFSALATSARTVCMFFCVSLFWACWTKPDFLVLIGEALRQPDAIRGIGVVLSWVAGAIVTGAVLFLIHERYKKGEAGRAAWDLSTSIKLHLAGLSLVLAVVALQAEAPWNAYLKQQIVQFQADPAENQISRDRLQSYYEDLNSAVIQAGPLISSFSIRDDAGSAKAEGFYKVSRRADLYQQIELIPGIRTELEGETFSVNQFGMRDRATLTLRRPQNTVRIALVGSSIVMGYGVSDEDVFSHVFESRLNADLANGRHYQVLNFGVGKQWAPHRLVRIQRQVIGFHPDALFYFAHQDEFRELASHASQLVAQRLDLPSPQLKQVVDSARVTSDMAPGAIQSQLQRNETELLEAIYRSIVDECRQREIIPTWIYLPIPDVTTDDVRAKLIPIATRAGFVVVDLSDWAVSREGLFRAEEEFHPNSDGHRRIAEALVRMIKSHPETISGISSSAE